MKKEMMELLKAYIKKYNIINADIEIDKAIGVINDRRRFTPTVNKPYDMKYQHLIVPLCVFALAKVGIEGETSHSENGVQRIYAGDSDYPQDILNGIVPLAK